VAKYVFESTHGVLLSPDGSPDHAEAIRFERVLGVERDSVNYKKVYRYETNDLDKAKRLRAINDYGITEVKGSE